MILNFIIDYSKNNNSSFFTGFPLKLIIIKLFLQQQLILITFLTTYTRKILYDIFLLRLFILEAKLHLLKGTYRLWFKAQKKNMIFDRSYKYITQFLKLWAGINEKLIAPQKIKQIYAFSNLIFTSSWRESLAAPGMKHTMLTLSSLFVIISNFGLLGSKHTETYIPPSNIKS